MPSDNVIAALANGESTNLVFGEIVRQSTSAKNTALRSRANLTASIQGTLGVVLSGSVGPGGPVFIASAGPQRVLLETGLTPVVGQWVFVSTSTAGRGTNVQPTNAVPLGTILDTSTYARDGRVLVSMPTVLLPASVTQTGLLSSADAAKLATVPTGSGIGQAFFSAVVDASTTGDTAWGADWPANRAGYLYAPVLVRPMFTDISGVHAVNVLGSIGSNAGKNNYIITGTILAGFGNINTLIAAGVTKNQGSQLVLGNAQAALPEMSGAPGAAPTINVSQACTAATVCKFRVAYWGVWIPFTP